MTSHATDADAELATFVHDKLQTESGRRQLRDYLRDTVDVMVDHHAIGAIAAALKYAGLEHRIEQL